MSAFHKLIRNEDLTACLMQGDVQAPYMCIAYGEVAFVTPQAAFKLSCIYMLCVSVWAHRQTTSFQLPVYPSCDFSHMLFKVVCLHVSRLMFNCCCCLCWQCTVKAASALHDKLFRRLLVSPMRFFDTTPLGHILTRFSRDMDEGEDWFVLTRNLFPKRVLSQWSHPGWQGVLLSSSPEGVAFCYPHH